MCFYMQMSADAVTLKNRFNREFQNPEIQLKKSIINGFEHPEIPIVLPNNSFFQFYSWGLIPVWAKDSSFRKNALNAKIETLPDKPTFKNVIQNRCLIPATGFFEWQWLDEKGKQKNRYLIQSSEQTIFSFAGLWAEWIDKTTGEIHKTFSILTTKANVLMSEIHNTKKRMPVILEKNDEEKWLQGQEYNQFAFPYQCRLTATLI